MSTHCFLIFRHRLQWSWENYCVSRYSTRSQTEKKNKNITAVDLNWYIMLYIYIIRVEVYTRCINTCSIKFNERAHSPENNFFWQISNFHNAFFFAIGDVLRVTSLTGASLYCENYENRLQFPHRRRIVLCTTAILWYEDYWFLKNCISDLVASFDYRMLFIITIIQYIFSIIST